jgi:hypothetical protein
VAPRKIRQPWFMYTVQQKFCRTITLHSHIRTVYRCLTQYDSVNRP